MSEVDTIYWWGLLNKIELNNTSIIVLPVTSRQETEKELFNNNNMLYNKMRFKIISNRYIKIYVKIMSRSKHRSNLVPKNEHNTGTKETIRYYLIGTEFWTAPMSAQSALLVLSSPLGSWAQTLLRQGGAQGDRDIEEGTGRQRYRRGHRDTEIKKGAQGDRDIEGTNKCLKEQMYSGSQTLASGVQTAYVFTWNVMLLKQR